MFGLFALANGGGMFLLPIAGFLPLKLQQKLKRATNP